MSAAAGSNKIKASIRAHFGKLSFRGVEMANKMATRNRIMLKSEIGAALMALLRLGSNYLHHGNIVICCVCDDDQRREMPKMPFWRQRQAYHHHAPSS